jgi:hypothetical protein
MLRQEKGLKFACEALNLYQHTMRYIPVKADRHVPNNKQLRCRNAYMPRWIVSSKCQMMPEKRLTRPPNNAHHPEYGLQHLIILTPLGHPKRWRRALGVDYSNRLRIGVVAGYPCHWKHLNPARTSRGQSSRLFQNPYFRRSALKHEGG